MFSEGEKNAFILGEKRAKNGSSFEKLQTCTYFTVTNQTAYFVHFETKLYSAVKIANIILKTQTCNACQIRNYTPINELFFSKLSRLLLLSD